MRRNKIFTVLLCALLLAAPCAASAGILDRAAPLNPAYVEYMNRMQDKTAAQTSRAANSVGETDTAAFGYVPSPLNWSHLSGKTWDVTPETADGAMRAAANEANVLSAVYDMRNTGLLPAVRRQHPFGNCWTHSAMAATESNLIKNGLADKSIELSEWYITYYAYNDCGDMPGFCNTTGSDYHSIGGDDWRAVALLSRGTGSVSAASVPNVDSKDAIYVPTITKREYRLEHALYLGDSGERELPIYDNGRVEMIKRALMEYGALSVGIHMDYSNFLNGDAYYTGKEYGYEEGKLSTNHAVTLVGWDDTYPIEKFKEGNRPDENGAWIVRNSWGDNWGDGGYFYVSYKEKTFCDGVAYVTSKAPANERIYQYDELGCATWIPVSGGDEDGEEEGEEAAEEDFGEESGEDRATEATEAWFANLFTAESGDRINAAALYVPQPGTEYEVSIYKNCAADSPVSGTKAATVTTDALLPGYNTVKFESPVEVSAGERFSVVVKVSLKAGDYLNVVPIETNMAGDIYQNIRANSREGWISDDGENFTDVMEDAGDGEYASICLKAFGENGSASGGGGGGGCSAGWGALVLLALVPLAMKKKK